MRDELFQPTVTAVDTAGKPPWRLQSQMYVAFFGGSLAGATIGFLNAGRLGVPAGRRRLILLAGAVAFLASLLIVLQFYGNPEAPGLRMLTRIPAVLAYLVQARLVRPFDRAFELRGGEHAPLWVPGLAAVIGLGIAEALVVAAIVATIP